MLTHADFVHRIQDRGVYIGNRSQYETLPVDEYIKDRNLMSIKHEDLEFPAWTQKGLDSI